MLILGAGGDADGPLLRAVLGIVQLVRGARGVPAVTSAGLVDHREGQEHRLSLRRVEEVVRTLSIKLARATGTNVRMGGHLIAAVVLVGQVTKEPVAKEVIACVQTSPLPRKKSGEETYVNRRRK